MESRSNAHNPHFAIETTAVETAEGKFLVISVANQDELPTETPSLQIALVLDRSSSMGGEKIQIARMAAAEMVRSLNPTDRVAAVMYDDRVDVISRLAVPDEILARKLERIDVRGSTNLYGGWVQAAKLVGPGGRVLLLSDGQANVGRFTDARNLAIHASLSREKFGVTTSTVGVGTDYDEELMAEMARAGGGNHYYAHSPEAILQAFSRERFSAEALVVEEACIIVDSAQHALGSFWTQEKKMAVVPVVSLPRLLSVSFRLRGESTWIRVEVPVPTEFCADPVASLEVILDRVAATERESATVRNSRQAQELAKRVRELLLRLLAHPLSQEGWVMARIEAMERTLERLEQLGREYEEGVASDHRKRSHQRHFNDLNRSRSFSSFEEEIAGLVAEKAIHFEAYQAVAPSAQGAEDLMSGIPLERWVEWKAAPVGRRGKFLLVGCEDPTDGFLLEQIRRAASEPVKLIPLPMADVKAHWARL